MTSTDPGPTQHAGGVRGLRGKENWQKTNCSVFLLSPPMGPSNQRLRSIALLRPHRLVSRTIHCCRRFQPFINGEPLPRVPAHPPFPIMRLHRTRPLTAIKANPRRRSPNTRHLFAYALAPTISFSLKNSRETPWQRGFPATGRWPTASASVGCMNGRLTCCRRRTTRRSPSCVYRAHGG